MKKFCHVLGLLSLFAFLVVGCSVNITRSKNDISFYRSGAYGTTNVKLSKEKAFEGEEVEIKIDTDSAYYLKKISFTPETVYFVESESLVKFIMPGRDLRISLDFDKHEKIEFNIDTDLTNCRTSFPNYERKKAPGQKVEFTLTSSTTNNFAEPIFTDDSLKIVADGNVIEYTIEDIGSGKYSFIMPEANVLITAKAFLPVFLSLDNASVVRGNKLKLNIDNKTDLTAFDISLDGEKKEADVPVASGKNTIELDTTGMYVGLHNIILKSNSTQYSDKQTFNVLYPGAPTGWTCVSFDANTPSRNKVDGKTTKPQLNLKLNQTDITKAKIKYYWDDMEDDIHERFFPFSNYSITLDESAPSETSVLHVWVYDEILKISSEQIDL